MGTQERAEIRSGAVPAGDGLSELRRGALDQHLQSHLEELPDEVSIPRRAERSTAPLSFSQQQVWLHGQIVGDIPLYNQGITIYRYGSLDVAVLERCLVEIVRRHEIWRTTFDSVGDEPVQIIHPAPDSFPIQVVDLRSLPEADRNAKAVQLATEDVRRLMDLKSGPLLRALLVRMSDEEHRLYMALHHLVFDAVTVYRAFLPELETLYEAFSSGKASPLAEPRLQYADFATWQRQTSSEALARQVAYWKKQLEGELSVCQWPGHPRPAVDTHRGAIERFTLQKDLVQKLRTSSQFAGATLYMSLLAGFAALLHRYTGQTEVVLGVLTAGRDLPELEDVMGPFVNPLALRVNVGGNPTFRELLSRVRDVLLTALMHGNIPFADVVKLAQHNYDPSRHPLFQIALSQQPRLERRVAGWELATEEVSNGCAEMDFFMVLDDRGETVSGPITYNRDLFDANAVRSVIGHWQTLLQAAAEHPEKRISDFPLLTAEERGQFAAWNDTVTEFPSGQCIHELVEAQASRTPQAIAVEHGRSRLSYQEFNERANQLAHFLRKRGIGPETTVGVYLSRSLELPVALLAVLKSGAACLPLDPAYPKDRLAYMLEDSQTALVLTQPGLLPEVTALNVEAISLESDWKVFSGESREDVDSGVTPENLAYVIYTSGSTGKPRGVMLEHRGLVNHNFAAIKLYGFSANDRVLQFSSISFDIAIEEMFPTWMSGGTLVLKVDSTALVASEFLSWIGQERITVLDLPTAYWHELVRQLSDIRQPLPETLRLVIVGGEKASAAALSDWKKVAGSAVRWVNTYGPTEASVIATAYEPGPEFPAQLPIGRPIANAQVYILDSHLQEVPVGVRGELHIGGSGLARGYLNRADLTAAKFIPSPFSEGYSSRLYKTGDMARYLPDGNIEFLGRTDDQIKIRGFRVELGEIETVVNQYPDVEQAVVTVCQNDLGENSLVAYVVPTRTANLLRSEVMRFLQGRLPEYMLPSSLVVLEEIPLTPNGKLDRRALPAPSGADSAAADAENFVGPRDGLEGQLVKIWESILGKNPIGIRQNFFALGGHSLLAVRLVHRIAQETGRKLAIAALLQAPTVEQLAEFLRERADNDEHSSLVALQPDGWRPPFFCVHGIGGTVLRFYDLARYLGPDQPVYALQAQGVDGKRPCLRSVEEMANLYVREIRRLQPRGPYYLGGYSLGGSVALEMARRLQAEGEEIGLVALLDTFVGFESNGGLLAKFWTLASRDKLYHLNRKARTLGKKIKRTVAIARLPRALKDVREACAEAARRYDAQPYSGKVTLFQAQERSLSSPKDPVASWKAIALGGIEVHEVPGGHGSIVDDPQVKVLARELKDCLQRTQGEYFRVVPQPISDREVYAASTR